MTSRQKMKKVLALSFAAVLLDQAPAVSAGVCEQAHIPLHTIELEGGGAVCVVPFCGNEEQKTTPWGNVTCMKCDQTPWQATFEDYKEKTDVCPTALGECVDGVCCGQKGADTWYNKNFKRDYDGIGTFPHVTVTTYHGETATGGTVAEADAYVRSQGIDGVAAVPSVMFGSWMKNMWLGSQQSYVNNNICYKVTTMDDLEFTLAIWGKCGGYTQCPGLELSAGLPGRDFFSDRVSRISENGKEAEWFDANRCINVAGVSIAAGTTPDCISTAGGMGRDDQGLNCCPHFCQTHVDWCGSNDHPHFDISESLYDKICTSTTEGGPCVIKRVDPVLCNWNPPVNPQEGNWTPRFPQSYAPGEGEAAPVHEPYPFPSCWNRSEPSDPPATPTEPGNPAPPPSSGLKCDEVVSSNIPDVGESCGSPICSMLCNSFKGGCSDDASCINDKIEDAICPTGGNCGCVFA